jgi:multisite-specific tRNA:(cytosine-C5)-methyltransferase
VQAETPIDPPTETPIPTSVEPSVDPLIAIEEEALKKEKLALGQGEQEQVDTRETYTKASDEEDRFNTTV